MKESQCAERIAGKSADFDAAGYTVVAADGSEVTFPEDTVFTVETQRPERWKKIAGAYAYDDGALNEVKHSGTVFGADTLDDVYVFVNAAEADETELANETELAGENEATEETELAAETETAEETN